MSTRSTIWMKTGSDDDISPYTGIYCHYDGYPEYNGEILKEYYNTKEKVEELLKLGDLSSLGKTIDTCIAYHRDRGEEFNQYKQHYPRNFEEYMYIFNIETNEWEIY